MGVVNNIDVQVLKTSNDAVVPVYARESDAGFDFVTVDSTVISPFSTIILNTGLRMAIPEGYELQVRPRSGVSVKTPLIIKNSPGTIDAGYRGDIGIIVHNLSSDSYYVAKGTRIAQGVIAPVMRAKFVEVERLEDTDRGEGGFGHTGDKI